MAPEHRPNDDSVSVLQLRQRISGQKAERDLQERVMSIIGSIAAEYMRKVAVSICQAEIDRLFELNKKVDVTLTLSLSVLTDVMKRINNLPDE